MTKTQTNEVTADNGNQTPVDADPVVILHTRWKEVCEERAEVGTRAEKLRGSMPQDLAEFTTLRDRHEAYAKEIEQGEHEPFPEEFMKIIGDARPSLSLMCCIYSARKELEAKEAEWKIKADTYRETAKVEVDAVIARREKWSKESGLNAADARWEALYHLEWEIIKSMGATQATTLKGVIGKLEVIEPHPDCLELAAWHDTDIDILYLSITSDLLALDGKPEADKPRSRVLHQGGV